MPVRTPDHDSGEHVCKECLRVFETGQLLTEHIAKRHEVPVT
jgi:hypothetical protein